MDSAARLAPSAVARDSVVGVLAWTQPHEAVREVAGEPRESFATLVREHQRFIYGYLRARLLEPADAEDCCQEVFLRCYIGREKIERATSTQQWLVGIARNVLREHVRKLTRRREVAWTELCLELDALTPTQNSLEHDLLQHMPHCLDGLGPSAREAIDWRYKTSLSLESLAKHFRRSEGAVKLLLHRARTALRNCLERKLQGEKHAP